MLEENKRRETVKQREKMELSLDLSLDICPSTISDVIAEVSELKECSEKMLKIGYYLKGLEEEMRKIEVFKKELPLCVLLLRDAILTLKEESDQFKELESENQAQVKEFVSLKMKSVENEVNLRADCSDKKNGSSDITFDDKKNDCNAHFKLTSEQVSGYSPENQIRPRNCRNETGGFEKIDVQEDGESPDVLNLTLITQISNSGSENSNLKSRKRIRDGSSSSSSPTQMKLLHTTQPQQQGLRKQRRSWSPELHRRFIDALERLGGSQAATPKQIRDLMKVEGLTNDEVKSHLQKYRLHIRKLERTDSPQAHSAMEGDGVHGEEEEEETIRFRRP